MKISVIDVSLNKELGLAKLPLNFGTWKSYGCGSIPDHICLGEGLRSLECSSYPVL